MRIRLQAVVTLGVGGLIACTSTVTGTGSPGTSTSSSSSSSGTSGASSGATSTSSGSTSTSSGSTGACANIDGVWDVTGDCAPGTCSISQTDCAITLACDGALSTFQGSVDASHFTYSGTGADGYPTTCSGTVGPGGTGASGSCTSQGVSCGFNASKLQ